MGAGDNSRSRSRGRDRRRDDYNRRDGDRGRDRGRDRDYDRRDDRRDRDRDRDRRDRDRDRDYDRRDDRRDRGRGRSRSRGRDRSPSRSRSRSSPRLERIPYGEPGSTLSAPGGLPQTKPVDETAFDDKAPITVGSRVVALKLQANEELNGQTGSIRGKNCVDSFGRIRWNVEFDKQEHGTKALCATNLRVIVAHTFEQFEQDCNRIKENRGTKVGEEGKKQKPQWAIERDKQRAIDAEIAARDAEKEAKKSIALEECRVLDGIINLDAENVERLEETLDKLTRKEAFIVCGIPIKPGNKEPAVKKCLHSCHPDRAGGDAEKQKVQHKRFEIVSHCKRLILYENNEGRTGQETA